MIMDLSKLSQNKCRNYPAKKEDEIRKKWQKKIKFITFGNFDRAERNDVGFTPLLPICSTHKFPAKYIVAECLPKRRMNKRFEVYLVRVSQRGFFLLINCYIFILGGPCYKM